MHNIKDIRNNFDNFKNIIKSRNVSIDLDEILDLDKKNRKLIQEKESLEQEKKSISKKQDKSLFFVKICKQFSIRHPLLRFLCLPPSPTMCFAYKTPATMN